MNNQPKIILFMISNSKNIEYEYSSFKGNHINLTKKTIIPNIKKEGKIILVYHNYEYISNKIDNLVFICLVERGYNKCIAFSFLDEVLKIYQLNHSLEEKKMLYIELINRFNEKNIDKSKLVMDKLMDLKDVVTENLNKIITSNEKLDILENKISEISKNSENIYVKSKKVRRKI